MEYILDTTPLVMNNINHDLLKLIEDKISKNESLTDAEASYFLDYLVYVTRCKVVKDFSESFEYKCDLAQSIMTYYLRRINATTIPCSTQSAIDANVEGHNFNIVKLRVNDEDRDYIVDATYRQFFLKDNCQDSKFIVINGVVVVSAHPGYFILKKDYPLVREFLYHGYMEMNEETAKIYGDSFFQTKTNIPKDSVRMYRLPGGSYMTLFLKDGVDLSKSEEELRDIGLLIEPLNNELGAGIKF